MCIHIYIYIYIYTYDLETITTIVTVIMVITIIVASSYPVSQRRVPFLGAGPRAEGVFISI